MDFQQLIQELYLKMISKGKKYSGGTKPENIWWCVEKDRSGNENKRFEALMLAMAKREGIR